VCRRNVHIQITPVWIKAETKVSECNQLLQRMLLSALLIPVHAALDRNSYYWEDKFIIGSCCQAKNEINLRFVKTHNNQLKSQILKDYL
jgi:hypothetical protein